MKTFRHKRTLLILIVALLTLPLAACGTLESKVHSLNGSIFGNTYTIDSFDNFGNLTLQTHGEKIDIKGNFVETVDIGSDGDIIYDKELSSVVTLTIDGHEMKSCGNTMIFYEDGLSPEVNFKAITNITSLSESLSDATAISGIVNSVKNSFGKPVIIVVQSQLGAPIYAFSGDKVTEEIPKNLPKFTKLMVDGHALYLHRCNYQLIDTALVNK